MMFIQEFPDEFILECKIRMDEDTFEFWFGETGVVDILGYVNIKNLEIYSRPIEDFLLYEGEYYAILYISSHMKARAAGWSDDIMGDIYKFDDKQLENIKAGRHLDAE